MKVHSIISLRLTKLYPTCSVFIPHENSIAIIYKLVHLKVEPENVMSVKQSLAVGIQIRNIYIKQCYNS